MAARNSDQIDFNYGMAIGRMYGLGREDILLNHEVQTEPVDREEIPRQTRRESLEAIRPDCPEKELYVLSVLRKFPDGATAEEAAASVGQHPQVFRPRLTEMHGNGMVYVIGKKKSRTTGRQVSVYKAPPEL